MNREMNPFDISGNIEIGKSFIERDYYINYIVSSIMSRTSINIVGKEFFGKSCLLYHFYQIWYTLISEPNKYVVIYLSLGNTCTTSEKSFYKHIAEELCSSGYVNKDSELYKSMQIADWNRKNFNQAVGKWKELGVLPILCLDDFDLLVNRVEFDNDFYDNLRYLMSGNKLMLIIASLKRLKIYKGESHLTSNFFNIGIVIYLEHFTDIEVDTLLKIADSSGKSALSVSEQYLARRWGKKHPYLLQLACFCLFKAKHLGKDVDWAEKEFRNQKDNVPTHKDKFLDWLGNIPKIGGYLKKAIVFIGDSLTFIGATFILIAILFLLTGYITWDSFLEMLPSWPK